MDYAHHTNPVAMFSRKIDSPEFLVEQALEKHRRMTYDCSIRGRSRGYAGGAEKSDEHPPLRAEPRRGANDLRRDQQILRTLPPEPHRTVYEQTTGMGGERGLPPCRTFGGGQPHYSAQQHYEPTSYRRTPRRTTHTTTPKTLFCALFHLRPFHHGAPRERPLRLTCSTNPSPHRRAVTLQLYQQQQHFSLMTSLLYRL